MDDLPRVSEPALDVAAAERAGDARWQTRGRPKGAVRRKPKKGEPVPTTTSGDGSGSHTHEEGDQLPRTDPDEETPVDQEVSGACYGRDKTIASTLPSKGRLIDIAI